MLSDSGGLTVVVLARDGRIRLGVALSACSVPRRRKEAGRRTEVQSHLALLILVRPQESCFTLCSRLSPCLTTEWW